MQPCDQSRKRGSPTGCGERTISMCAREESDVAVDVGTPGARALVSEIPAFCSKVAGRWHHCTGCVQ